MQLLFTILGDQSLGLSPEELRQCLDAIIREAPDLSQDHRFRRVDEFARRLEI
ncbi:hypothetical protein [Nitrosomonas sp. PY1]|uniref:hypothetical protein n=1 Tax=Nitrosomonas sp. PY1 TaxID=1803906 RepID=UPI001FC895FF|nr:hypothetical protein [Nitrosomonas sp. PY1]